MQSGDLLHRRATCDVWCKCQRYSLLVHSTFAPTERRFSTNLGCARRIGKALVISERPSMLAATISSAIATRMMYGLSTLAGVSVRPPNVISRCGSDKNTCAPNFDHS